MNEFVLAGVIEDYANTGHGRKILLSLHDGGEIVLTIYDKDIPRLKERMGISLPNAKGARVMVRGIVTPLKKGREVFPEAPILRVKAITVLTYESMERSFRETDARRAEEDDIDVCPF